MIHEILLFLITGFIAFLCGFIKKMVIMFEKKFKTMELANQNMLRGQIVGIYYSYKEKKKIPFYQKEVANACADAYTKSGGNSFVQDLINEINEWEVV